LPGFFIFVNGMLTKNTIKFIRSLSQKKFRDIHGCFIAEGPKTITDIINSPLKTTKVFALPHWLDANQNLCKNIDEVTCITENELSSISLLSTPNNVLAVVAIPGQKFNPADASGSLIITLDDIRDPGNLGTIIRIADWFGFRHILCSETSVDVYNPKCIQSTMGSIARINVYYERLEHILPQNSPDIPVYGAFLNGENIFNEKLGKNGYLVIGNEANGISPAIAGLVNRRLHIPSGTDSGTHAESLNASIATAIICSEFFRRTLPTTK